jgi:hypothetical protein
LLHQVGDLYELNVKLQCQKVNAALTSLISHTCYKYTHFIHLDLITQMTLCEKQKQQRPTLYSPQQQLPALSLKMSTNDPKHPVLNIPNLLFSNGDNCQSLILNIFLIFSTVKSSRADSIIKQSTDVQAIN